VYFVCPARSKLFERRPLFRAVPASRVLASGSRMELPHSPGQYTAHTTRASLTLQVYLPLVDAYRCTLLPPAALHHAANVFRRPSEFRLSSATASLLPSSDTEHSPIQLLHSTPSALDCISSPLVLLPAARSICQFFHCSLPILRCCSLPHSMAKRTSIRLTTGSGRAQPDPSMTRSLPAPSLPCRPSE
jgi:hypothetical protein